MRTRKVRIDSLYINVIPHLTDSASHFVEEPRILLEFSSTPQPCILFIFLQKYLKI